MLAACDQRDDQITQNRTIIMHRTTLTSPRQRF
jgi:hypothetical protein